MIKSLYSGVSGLKTHNQRMDVIGNNIANVNTTAFKAGTVTFKDVYYQTRQRASGGDWIQGGVNPMQTGMGAQLGTISKVMTQSGLTYSDSVFDMALEGSGFFQVMDQAGNIFYTRLGRFGLDDFGNLVDPNGNVVLGVSGDPTGVMAGTQRINIAIPDIEDAAAFAVREFVVGRESYEVIIRANDIGPGGNIAVTITHSDSPFATMSGSSLNVFMDLSRDYESDAGAMIGATPRPVLGAVVTATQRDLLNSAGLAPPIPAAPAVPTAVATEAMLALWTRENLGGPRIGVPLTMAQANAIGLAAIPAATTAAHVAAWEQELVLAISDMFSDDLAESVRLGGVNIDPAIMPLQVEFSSVPNPTAAQSASNYRAIPAPSQTLIEANFGGIPVVGQPLTQEQADAINRDGGAVVAAGTAAIAAHVTRFNDSVTAVLTAGSDLFFEFTVTNPGAAGNSRTVEVSVGNTSFVTANWRNNVLQITLPENAVDITPQMIQDAITNAGGGVDVQVFQSTTPANPVTRNYLAMGDTDINTIAMTRATTLRVGMAGGTDSFFQSAFRSFSTTPLRGGAYQSAQSPDTADIFVDRDGIIYGEHPVHGLIVLGRVDIVDFVNPEGLMQVGTSYFVATMASGPPQVRQPQTESDTMIISGALEMSNVDLSNEFSDMIVTQRGFQANSRIITVSDSMLEELVNLKR